MCGTVLAEEHGHVADVENRSIRCACRPCFLLFTRDNKETRYRAVPTRCLYDPDAPVSSAEWESLGIPVAAAFFLRSDDAEHPLSAFYPSPAGATECLLDLTAWAELVAAHPLLGMALPDVEAILIRNTKENVACYLVPIDRCYLLVGTVRMYWQGFDGGAEAQERIEEFFTGIRDLARPVARG